MLKAGWETKKFSDVLDIRNGRNQKAVESENGIYPILGSAGNVMAYPTDYICEAGTTIIGRKGNISNPIYVETQFWNVDTAFGLSPKAGLNNKFLYYYCLSYDFSALNRGTTIPSLVKSELLEIPIPLPPLPEQTRIVAILDEAFANISQAVVNAEKNLANARELFDSYLNEVFTRKGEGWEERSFTDICDITSKLVDPRKPENVNLPHIGAGNIASNTGALIDVKTALEEELISGKFLFDDTMILYSKIRPYLKKVCRPEFSGLCSADVYPLTPNKALLDKNFLFYMLLSDKFTKFAIMGSDRAGMPKVNRNHLFSYRCFLPNIKEQKYFADCIDELAKKTQELEGVYRRKLAALAELKQALLQKAFTGELTAADQPT